MRLILPTGEDGADRSYPLDGIMDLSRVTLNETIELRRATGLNLRQVYAGFSTLDAIIGESAESTLFAMSQHLELMEAWRALVWLARYRNGDRSEGGSVLTVEEAVDFPFVGIDVQADPGDEDAAEDEEPGPTRPAGGRATAAGGRTKPRRGRSSTTSTSK